MDKRLYLDYKYIKMVNYINEYLLMIIELLKVNAYEFKLKSNNLIEAKTN